MNKELKGMSVVRDCIGISQSPEFLEVRAERLGYMAFTEQHQPFSKRHFRSANASSRLSEAGQQHDAAVVGSHRLTVSRNYTRDNPCRSVEASSSQPINFAHSTTNALTTPLSFSVSAPLHSANASPCNSSFASVGRGCYAAGLELPKRDISDPRSCCQLSSSTSPQ